MTTDTPHRGPHIVDGEFKSDKYPSCPRGKVPLSTKDPMAQDLLWQYAQRRRSIDAEFASDLEWALAKHGYTPKPDSHYGLIEALDGLLGIHDVWLKFMCVSPEILAQAQAQIEPARAALKAARGES